MILEFQLKTKPEEAAFLRAFLLIDHTKIKQIYTSLTGVTLIEDDSGQISEITESAEAASEAVYKAQRVTSGEKGF